MNSQNNLSPNDNLKAYESDDTSYYFSDVFFPWIHDQTKIIKRYQSSQISLNTKLKAKILLALDNIDLWVRRKAVTLIPYLQENDRKEVIAQSLDLHKNLEAQYYIALQYLQGIHHTWYANLQTPLANILNRPNTWTETNATITVQDIQEDNLPTKAKKVIWYFFAHDNRMSVDKPTDVIPYLSEEYQKKVITQNLSHQYSTVKLETVNAIQYLNTENREKCIQKVLNDDTMEVRLETEKAMQYL
jgi:hypothetical protein